MVFQGCFEEVLSFFKEDCGVFQETLKGYSKFKRCFNILIKFEGCLKKCKVCFKKILNKSSRMLDKVLCCTDLIAAT